MSSNQQLEEEISRRENITEDEDTVGIIPENDFKTLEEAEKNQLFLTEKQLRYHINAIRGTIRAEEKRIRAEYPWVNQQNTIGLVIFFVSLAALLVNAIFYLKGVYSWYISIPIAGIFVSFLHELEHDLIHNLYFKGKAWVQHAMFFTIWMTKLNVNPWYRKVLHLRHHLLSGQTEDLEERFVGLGMPLDWLRFLIQIYPFANISLFPRLKKDNEKVFGYDMWMLVVLINTPSIVTSTILLHLYLGFTRLHLGLVLGSFDPVLSFPTFLWPFVRDACVLMVFPNLIRQLSLNIIASYSHYYGDIPKYNVYYQNQVLNHWVLYPLQAFCFNFGETHIIHHFVTNQPFYLRQWLAPKAVEELTRHGIRKNDFDIVRRSNRFFDVEEEIKKGA